MPGLLLFRGFAMRPESSFHSWYHGVRSARVALAAAAVAALVVVAACTDNRDNALTGPSIRKSNTSSGHEGNGTAGALAGTASICVDPTSPVGDYVFTYSDLNNQAGLPGNHFEDGGFWTDDGGDWQSPFPPGPTTLADGGVTSFTPNQTGVTIHNNGNVGTPDCQLVMTRTSPRQQYTDAINANPPQTAVDSWAGVTITATSNNAGANYDHTDC